MEGKVTLGTVIAFLKIYLTFASCWPLPANTTKLRRFLRSALRCFCCANAVIISVTGIWTIYKHNDDTLLMMKVGCQLSAIVQIPVQLVLFAAQDQRLQFIVTELEEYYRRAQNYEEKIFQQYVDKCKILYSGIIIWVMIAGITVIFGPLFLPQPFPCNMEYPFDIRQPMKTIIFAHHVLTVFQSITQVSANTFCALLLWFIAARFDMLSVRFRTVNNVKELTKCAREHRILLRYAKEVTLAIRYTALSCITFSTGAVIFGCLIFLGEYPWSVKWSFFTIALGGFVELYMYAWPADNVISSSTNIAFAAYESLWYNKDPSTQKILLHVISRSQDPVIISIPFALPTLSMKYYTSYISTIFSYMTMIRIIMSEE